LLMHRTFALTLAVLSLILSCRNSKTPDAKQAEGYRMAADTLTAEQRAYLLGKFDQGKRADFVAVGKPYSDKMFMYLRKEAFDAFQKMHAAAAADGINLKIISSSRNFIQQKAIWESKWAKNTGSHPEPLVRARKILQYSAMPGASRHHWGTDVDLNDLNNEAFMEGGPHAKVYTWLTANASKYGFCQPYTALDEKRPNGYHEERWHWSYMPLSGPLLLQYRQHLGNADLTGFKGAEYADTIQVVQHYVSGINPNCK